MYSRKEIFSTVWPDSLAPRANSSQSRSEFIKAIVLKNLTEVQNPEVLDRLADYAEKGLTILCLDSNVASVSGTEGTKGESYTDESVAEKWAELCAYDNVISITTPEEVADYVESSIRYDVRSETTGSLESGWIEAKELKDSSAGVDYDYFGNGATTCYTTTESQKSLRIVYRE